MVYEVKSHQFSTTALPVGPKKADDLKPKSCFSRVIKEIKNFFWSILLDDDLEEQEVATFKSKRDKKIGLIRKKLDQMTVADQGFYFLGDRKLTEEEYIALDDDTKIGITEYRSELGKILDEYEKDLRRTTKANKKDYYELVHDPVFKSLWVKSFKSRLKHFRKYLDNFSFKDIQVRVIVKKLDHFTKLAKDKLAELEKEAKTQKDLLNKNQKAKTKFEEHCLTLGQLVSTNADQMDYEFFAEWSIDLLATMEKCEETALKILKKPQDFNNDEALSPPKGQPYSIMRKHIENQVEKLTKYIEDSCKKLEYEFEKQIPKNSPLYAKLSSALDTNVNKLKSKNKIIFFEYLHDYKRVYKDEKFPIDACLNGYIVETYDILDKMFTLIENAKDWPMQHQAVVAKVKLLHDAMEKDHKEKLKEYKSKFGKDAFLKSFQDQFDIHMQELKRLQVDTPDCDNFKNFLDAICQAATSEGNLAKDLLNNVFVATEEKQKFIESTESAKKEWERKKTAAGIKDLEGICLEGFKQVQEELEKLLKEDPVPKQFLNWAEDQKEKFQKTSQKALEWITRAESYPFEKEVNKRLQDLKATINKDTAIWKDKGDLKKLSGINYNEETKKIQDDIKKYPFKPDQREKFNNEWLKNPRQEITEALKELEKEKAAFEANDKKQHAKNAKDKADEFKKKIEEQKTNIIKKIGTLGLIRKESSGWNSLFAAFANYNKEFTVSDYPKNAFSSPKVRQGFYELVLKKEKDLSARFKTYLKDDLLPKLRKMKDPELKTQLERLPPDMSKRLKEILDAKLDKQDELEKTFLKEYELKPYLEMMGKPHCNVFPGPFEIILLHELYKIDVRVISADNLPAKYDTKDKDIKDKVFYLLYWPETGEYENLGIKK